MATSATKLMMSRSSIGKLQPSKTSFLLCDIQDKFRPLIYNSKTIISTAQYLTSVASALSIPIVATQQVCILLVIL
jgi:nicotinamidase-related amidase